MGKNIIESVYPLTAMQQGIYFECTLNESSNAYFIQNIFQMSGVINVDHMKTALDLLSDKYAVLRTRIMMSKKEEEPLQIVLREQTIELQEIECPSGMNPLEELKQISADDIHRGFDFQKDSLIRLTVVHVSESECFLILSVHHIIVDGWCSAIIMREFVDLYIKLCSGHSKLKLASKVKKEKKLMAPFSEYVKWQMNQDKKKGLAYWKNYLKDYKETASIPSLKMASMCEEKMAKYHICINKEDTSRMIKTAREHKVTLSNIAEMLWGLVLMKYAGLDDIVFGKVVSGRNADIKGIENAVGIYVNIVPERIKINKESTFQSVLRQIAEDYYEGLNYEYCPLAEIQAGTALKSHLIGSIFTFENFIPSNTDIGDPEYCKINLHAYREETNYEISVKAGVSETLDFDILYNPNTYTLAEISLIGQRIELFASELAQNVNTKISEMKLVTADETYQILNVFNATNIEIKEKETINSVFERIVEENADKVAVVCGAHKLTYVELNEKANSLSAHLIGKGFGQGDMIAVFAERKIEILIAFIAIQKIGGIYLPLDASQPERRIKMILEDANPKTILTFGKVNMDGYDSVDICDDAIYERCNSNPVNINTTNSYSYIIYTSGTTGKPKGVLLKHKGVVNLSKFFSDELKIGEEDRIAQFANYVFDASIWEFTMGILTGAELHILTKESIDDPMLCSNYFKKNKLTIVTLPPLYCKQLELPTMRYIITAGSASDENLVNAVKSKGLYINAYGPTEDTVCTTYYLHDSLKTYNRIPIGRPLVNHQVYIMKDNQLCPIGMPGELRICGFGVAEQYLNREELTENKFVNNPFGEGRMYCSGDLARWLPDGNIDFMGRIDKQVKIRGYRIELEEISNTLMSFEAINEAAAIVNEKKDNHKSIYAFYSSDRRCDADEVKTKLAEYLPEYMIPARLIQVQGIPVNASGKVDVEKLLDITVKDNIKLKEPVDATEKILEDIFCEILEEKVVDIEANFFEIGGESILAMKLMAIIEKRLGTKLTIADIYKHNSIKELANKIKLVNSDNDLSIERAVKNVLGNDGFKIIERSDGYILFCEENLDRVGKSKLIDQISKCCIVPTYIFHIEDFDKVKDKESVTSINEFAEFILKSKSQNVITDQYLDMVTEEISSYRNELLETKNGSSFEGSMLQKLAYDIGIRSSCGYFTVNGHFNKEVIENAWRRLLDEQHLLRGSLCYSNNKITINEGNVGNGWHLPYYDIVYYPYEEKHKIIQQIKDYGEIFYHAFMYSGKELAHGIAILKMTENEHLLMLPCSHLIFDGFSNTILKNRLSDLLDDENTNNDIIRYQECIKEFEAVTKKRGLQVASKLEIGKFKSTVTKFAKNIKKMDLTNLEYRYEFKDKEKKNIDMIRGELGNEILSNIIDFVFPDMKVPIYVVQNGRNSENSLECVGLFLDMIPVVYDSKNTNDFSKKLQSRITYLRDNKMNLLASMSSGYNEKSDGKLIQAPILYNNLLMYEMEDLFDKEEMSEEVAKRMINISISGNELCINCMCVNGKTQELCERLDMIMSNIANEASKEGII